MPNPLPTALRERAVRAYEDGDESCEAVAERLSLNPWSLLRWIARRRETGSVEPLPKRGGRVSPVNVAVLEALVAETPDATTDELTRVYNGRVRLAERVHWSSILRALHRQGYVFKKNGRDQLSRIVRTSKPPVRRSGHGRRR